MLYQSTRNYTPTAGADALPFSDILLNAIAPDGGLYIPQTYPAIDFDALKGKNYQEIAFEIIKLYTDLPEDILKDIIQTSYAPNIFKDKDVTPLRDLAPNMSVLELFHGPTLAFKDVALQFLGNVFDYILAQKKQSVTIIGATSGDTGSAAIEAFRGKKNVKIIILHPFEKTSDIQRRQMTTVLDDNVFNLAIRGNFDDAQMIIKRALNDSDIQAKQKTTAVNSINWARIVAQIVYYVAATVRLSERGILKPCFAVPTGNFGNVYAGYVAKQMGVPMGELIVGSNRNDILTRFFETGKMQQETVIPSVSPSMDIQISSNFERYFCDLVGRNSQMLNDKMNQFKHIKTFSVSTDLFDKARADFKAYRASDDDTLKTIEKYYRLYDYTLDPHTAVGVFAAEQSGLLKEHHIVALACAHPAKFPDTVQTAIGISPSLPPELSDLFDREERYEIIDNNYDLVKQFILKVS
jgi:threonine synthase